MPELIDLSHTVHDGLVTYPGLPAPMISDHLSREASRSHYSEGVEFHIGRIEMVANTGTYLDAPFHRYPQGTDLAELPLRALAALPGTLVPATARTDRGRHSRGRHWPPPLPQMQPCGRPWTPTFQLSR